MEIWKYSNAFTCKHDCTNVSIHGSFPFGCFSSSLHCIATNIYLMLLEFNKTYHPASLVLCLPALLPPCLPACLDACLPACLPVYLSTCLPSGSHTRPHAWLPAYLPACLLLFVPVTWSADLPLSSLSASPHAALSSPWTCFRCGAATYMIRNAWLPSCLLLDRWQFSEVLHAWGIVFILLDWWLTPLVSRGNSSTALQVLLSLQAALCASCL